MTWLFLLLIGAEIAVLGAWEARMFRTWATPFNALAVPFLAVAALAVVLAGPLDFVPLYWSTLALWACGLFVFWAVGVFVTRGIFYVQPRSVWKPQPQMTTGETRAVRGCFWMTALIIPITLRGVYSSAQSAGGWAQLGSLEFRTAFSHGAHAHAIVLALPITIMLLGTWRRGQWAQAAAAAVLVALLIVSGVKGTVMAALIGAGMYRVISGRFRF
jgi:hypothetical protein